MINSIFTYLFSLIILVGAVFGVAIVGTIFSNVLTENLGKIAIAPEFVEAVKQSATLVKELPLEIRGPVITAYVNALRSGFIADIPIAILCFIASMFMGSHKPKIN